MKLNRTLYVLAFICLIDAIGFGIMIPLIYGIGKQFGLVTRFKEDILGFEGGAGSHSMQCDGGNCRSRI